MSTQNPIRTAALVAGLLLGCAGGGVSAQTCQSPLPLRANQTVGGNTCAGSNSLVQLGGGAVDSPYADVGYSFTTPERDGYTTDAVVLAVLGGAPAMMALLKTCDGYAPIVDIVESSRSNTIWFDVPKPPFQFTRPPWGGRPDPVASVTYYVVVSATDTGSGAGCVEYAIERRT